VSPVVVPIAETVGGILFEPLDYILTGYAIAQDPTNPWNYVGFVPFIPASVRHLGKADNLIGGLGRHGDEVVGPLKNLGGSIDDAAYKARTYDFSPGRTTTVTPPVTTAPRLPISAQKQAGHVPSTPQYLNRINQGKPTSAFFGNESAERLTQEAWQKGRAVPGKPNVREYDFGVSVGTGPHGGMQTKVRVHRSPTTGTIHGHPSGPEH
jgi:hypothetical protein